MAHRAFVNFQTKLEADLQSIKSLDALMTDIVTELYQSVPFPDWRAVTMFSKYTPDASVSGHDFDFIRADGSQGLGFLPADAALIRLGNTTKSHWRLTQDLGQPRWYKMIVTVERGGKFSVDFEYKDDYQEGDIMKRG